VDSTRALKDTNWHHVAVAKSAGSVTFYVDGVGEAAPQFDPGFDFVSSVRIGAIQWDTTQPRASFLGSIDEVGVYNRALSTNEVGSIYAAGSAGKCTPPPPVTGFANGSFESPALAPGGSVILPAGSTTALTGWTVGNTGVVSFANGPTLGVNPVDGSQHIGFNGGDTAPGGSISQTFSTAV